MFPEDSPLDVPLIQVSTYHGYDLASQIALGEALRPLRCVMGQTNAAKIVLSVLGHREQGYVILGSGMAVHSFESMGEIWRLPQGAERSAKAEQVLRESQAFDAAIKDTFDSIKYPTYQQRVSALLALESLPEFKRSHPTVEVSLHVCQHRDSGDLEHFYSISRRCSWQLAQLESLEPNQQAPNLWRPE